MFVRQGVLLQVSGPTGSKTRKTRSRLTSFTSRQVTRREVGEFHAQLSQSYSGGSQRAESSTGHYGEGLGKELIRQCFLFTNHLLLCTRTKDGKLMLLEVS